MRTTQAISITLPFEMAQMVKAKVASGEYASESGVVRDGLRTLQARDNALEKWLREEVVQAYDDAKSKPAELKTGAQIRANLTKKHNVLFGDE